MNVIPLLQTKTADAAHTGIFVSVTSNFWAGPGDEAITDIFTSSHRWEAHLILYVCVNMWPMHVHVCLPITCMCRCACGCVYTCMCTSVCVCVCVCANVIQPSLFIVNIEVQKKTGKV